MPRSFTNGRGRGISDPAAAGRLAISAGRSMSSIESTPLMPASQRIANSLVLTLSMPGCSLDHCCRFRHGWEEQVKDWRRQLDFAPEERNVYSRISNRDIAPAERQVLRDHMRLLPEP